MPMRFATGSVNVREAKPTSPSPRNVSILAACSGLGAAFFFASLGLDPLSPATRIGTALVMTVFAWLSWELAAGVGRTALDGVGWALVGLTAAYMLGCLAAAYRGAALCEAALTAAFIPGFWLALHAGRSHKAPAILLDVILGTQTIVAAVGILAALGLISLAGAFEHGRLASTMVYPNALGIYLLWGLLIGCCRWAGVVARRAPVSGLPHAAACTVIAIALVMTFSRGTILAGLVGAALLLVLMPRGQRLASALFLLALSLPAAAVGLDIANAGGKGWTITAAAVAVGGVGVALGFATAAGMLLRPAPGGRPSGRRVVVACAVILVTVIAVGAVYSWLQLHGALVVSGGGPGVRGEIYGNRVKLAAGRYQLSGKVTAPSTASSGEWNVTVREAGGAYRVLASAKGEPTLAGEGLALEFEVPPGEKGVEVRVFGAGEGRVAALSELTITPRDGPPGPSSAAVRVRFLWSRLLAGSVAGRLSPSSWLGYSSLSRLTWMREGAHIALDHALLGAGGGGWAALLGQYQSYPYYSSDAHCHPVQVWVEAGTLGLLLYLLVWGGFAVQLVRAARSGAAAPLAGVAGGAGALFVQSAYDASFAFPAVTALLVIAWGLTSAAASRSSRRLPSPARWATLSPRLMAGVVRAGACLLVCALAAGTVAGICSASARASSRRGDIEASLAAWRRAAALSPLDADYHTGAARTARVLAERYESEHDRYSALALAEIQRAAALNPYSAQIRSLCGLIQLHSGQLQGGLQSLDRAIALQPYWSVHYDNLATAGMVLAEELCLIGRPDQAQKLTGRVVALEAELADRARGMPSWVTATVRTPNTTPALSFEVGRALLLRGQAADAVARLETAVRLFSAGKDEERHKLGHALAWLSYGYEMVGEREKASRAMVQALEADPEAQEVLAKARRAGKGVGLSPD